MTSDRISGLLILCVLAGAPTPLGARPQINPKTEAALAARFAPVLVYHPREVYFPVSPLFPLEGAEAGGLGTPRSRLEAYEALSLEEKEALATVFYRAYRGRPNGRDAIVLEYWLYYVRNDYRVRMNPLPFSIDATHPNDLEHIHLILSPSGPDHVVEGVYSSAHEGSMPANRLLFGDGGHIGPLHFLVELGSHAMAPDLDLDGRFTPGVDGDSGEKLVWGIRDRGTLWLGYSPDYMDTRGSDAWILSPEGTAPPPSADPQRTLEYRLVPVDALVEGVDRLALSDSERAAAFEERRNPLRRLVGGDDGSSESLIVPPPLQNSDNSFGIGSVSANESGFLFGTTLGLGESGAFLGARRTLATPRWFLPDFVVQAEGILTGRDAYFSSQFLLSYPVHAMARVTGGQELITDSPGFGNRQWNWVGGLEFRVGLIRIQAATQTSGRVTPVTTELRVAWFF